MKYSIVVPAHNENDSVEPLYQAVKGVFDKLTAQPSSRRSAGDGAMAGAAHKALADTFQPVAEKWEMIVIDDGSTDGTYESLQHIRERDDRVKIIRFRRNFGQTAGWSAGFDHAQGEYVVVLDADLQNDPRDIPAMIDMMERENLDVVSGWRRDRKDRTHMNALSKIGNWIHRVVTGEKIHDHGCVSQRSPERLRALWGDASVYYSASFLEGVSSRRDGGTSSTAGTRQHKLQCSKETERIS